MHYEALGGVKDRCNRAFVINVINTLDPDYFTQMMDEVEANLAAKKNEIAQMIEIEPEMYEIIDTMSNLKPNRSTRKNRIRLNLTKKKRKRPVRPELPPIKAKIKDQSTLGQLITAGANRNPANRKF